MGRERKRERYNYYCNIDYTLYKYLASIDIIVALHGIRQRLVCPELLQGDVDPEGFHHPLCVTVAITVDGALICLDTVQKEAQQLIFDLCRGITTSGLSLLDIPWGAGREEIESTGTHTRSLSTI